MTDKLYPNDPCILRMRITLEGVVPAVWRVVEVQRFFVLTELHQVIQAAFGWEDAHLYRFLIADGGLHNRLSSPTEYVDPTVVEPFAEDDEVGEDAREITIQQALNEAGTTHFLYNYDLGDDWYHHIVVETLVEPEAGFPYPRCIAGEGKRPPEDVGGPVGYRDYLEVIGNRSHPEYEEQREWGREMAPPKFSLKAINDAMRGVKSPKRPPGKW